MAALDDINSTQQNGVRLIGQLATTLAAVSSAVVNLSTNQATSNLLLAQIATTIAAAFPRINGTFTLSAATTTNVAEVRIASNGIISFTPTNATGALIQRTNGLFISIVTSGVGFQMSTQSGSATSGGTFTYMALNPA